MDIKEICNEIRYIKAIAEKLVGFLETSELYGIPLEKFLEVFNLWFPELQKSLKILEEFYYEILKNTKS